MVDCKECRNYGICEIRRMVEGKLKSCKSFEQKKPQTNADRIRAMSDEEMARFLGNFRQEQIANDWCLNLCPDRKEGECDCPYGGYETALGWLKTEIKVELPEELSGLELAQIAVALGRLKEYETIGTPSQCKEAVEKQNARKPTYTGDGYADGHLVYDTYECPNCGKQYEVDYDDYDHCPNCGQRFDMTMENEDVE